MKIFRFLVGIVLAIVVFILILKFDFLGSQDIVRDLLFDAINLIDKFEANNSDFKGHVEQLIQAIKNLFISPTQEVLDNS